MYGSVRLVYGEIMGAMRCMKRIRLEYESHGINGVCRKCKFSVHRNVCWQWLGVNYMKGDNNVTIMGRWKSNWVEKS